MPQAQIPHDFVPFSGSGSADEPQEPGKPAIETPRKIQQRRNQENQGEEEARAVETHRKAPSA